jgi:hypothetical protein
MNLKKCILILSVVVVSFFLLQAASARASVFESVQGSRFIVTGLSTGTIPVFTEVFVFRENGSFVMKKLEAYGEGSFYEYGTGVFYFIVTTQSGVDMQYAEGVGVSMNSICGQVIFGLGNFMIDYRIEPLVFFGTAVFQEPADEISYSGLRRHEKKNR